MSTLGNSGLLSRLRLFMLSRIRLPSHNQLAGLVWQARNHPEKRWHISGIQQVARNISRKLETGEAKELFLRVVSDRGNGYVVRLEPPKGIQLERIVDAYSRGGINFAYYPRNGRHAALFAGALTHSRRKSPVELFPGSVVTTAVVPHDDVLAVQQIQGSFNPKAVDGSGKPVVPAWLSQAHRGAVSRLLECVFDYAREEEFKTVRLVVVDADGGRQLPREDVQIKFKAHAKRRGYFPLTQEPEKISKGAYHWTFAYQPQKPRRASRK